MARALGIEAPLGSPFRCVVHREGHPSAALSEVAETGHWLYHDFHATKHGAEEWLTLAMVRAAQAGRLNGGKGRKLSRSEHATWKLILLVEAGLLPLQHVPAQPVPPGTPGLVRHVYERILFLLGARWNYSHGDPVPLERNFVAALAQTSERNARFSIDELEQLSRIEVVGKNGLTRLWLPADLNPQRNGVTP
jgi:hypothetical protein